MTPQEFAAKIRAKYPGSYDNVDDLTLSQKVVEKYPVYASQVNFEQDKPGYLSRVGSDIKNSFNEATQGYQDYAKNPTLKGGLATGANLAKNLTSAVLSPIAEAPGLKQVGEGFSRAGQAIVDTKIGNKATDYLASKASPETLKAISDVAETGLNVAALEGVGRTAKQIPQAYSATKNIVSNARGVIKDQFKVSPETQAKSINSLEDDYYKWAGQTKTGARNIVKTDARTAQLNQAGTIGKTPQRVLAENGIVPEIQGTKFNTADQAAQFRESVQPLNEALNLGLREVDQATTPKLIDDLQTNAVRQAREMKIPEGDKASLINDIKAEYELLRNKYGNSMSATEMQREKVNYNPSKKPDFTKPYKNDGNTLIRKSFQKGVEEQASKAEFDDVAQLNREIGDRLEAADYLESLHGNTLKYGRVGKYVFMGIGASLGNGLLGKIIGAAGGEIVGDLLMRSDVANPVKRLILRSIEKQSPEAYQETIKWLNEQNALRDIRPKLPERTNAPIPLPSKGVLSGQATLRK